MTMVRHEDLRVLGYCNRGSRILCARYRFNWDEFVRDGVDADHLKHIDDIMVKQLIQTAVEREAREIL